MTKPAPTPSQSVDKPAQDLSITALYTAQTWRWGQLPNAELFETGHGRVVFRITNFALAIAKLFIWSLRSLKHSLLHRHTMIDHLVHQEQPDLVVELAAGLSRRGSTLSADPALRYVEVDLPHVVAHKEQLLEASEQGRQIVARENWSLLAADVHDVELDELLSGAAYPIVICEGLFMYLSAEQQGDLWRRIAQALGKHDRGLLLFDLVPSNEQPKPGPIGRLLEWIMKRFTGGQSFERDERGRAEIQEELHQAGFPSVRLYEPHTVSTQWDLPYPHKKTQQLLFVCTLDADLT